MSPQVGSAVIPGHSPPDICKTPPNIWWHSPLDICKTHPFDSVLPWNQNRVELWCDRTLNLTETHFVFLFFWVEPAEGKKIDNGAEGKKIGKG